MFFWTEESIRWYQDASVYTDHHKTVVGEIKDMFDKKETILDLGCGLGFLDLELSPFVEHITGVDVEPRVIELMQQEAYRRGIENVDARVMDWKELPDECCDTVLICSFGSLRENLSDFMRICKKRVVELKRNSIVAEEGFITEYARDSGAGFDEQYLIEHEISYKSRCFQTDFGQPFCTREEAEVFMRHYRLDTRGKNADEYLQDLLIPIEHDTFHYFMPNKKLLQVIIIDKEDYLNSQK